MRPHKRKHTKQPDQQGQTTSTVKKGKIVERITAAFHDNPDVTIRLNAFLPVVGGGRRRREVDVLAIGQLAGYTMRIAFECKNERSPIGVQKIDEFIGKLNDVGIPPQNGVYVSASGYTVGAIERAQKEGVRTLRLEGLTNEGLSTILYEAFQAVVFLAAEIAQFTIEYVEEKGYSEHPYMFFNEGGAFSAFLQDFVWDAWLTGQIPLSIGEHPLDLKIHSGLYQVVSEKFLAVESVSVKLRSTGLVIGLPGKAEHLSLRDEGAKTLERSKVTVRFDTSSRQYPVTVILSEEELSSFLERPEAIKLVNRVRLPRIRTNIGVYWPPSERIISEIFERFLAHQMGKTAELAFDDLGEIEGTDLSFAWESISDKYLAARQYWRSVSEKKEDG